LSRIANEKDRRGRYNSEVHRRNPSVSSIEVSERGRDRQQRGHDDADE
jgi:hypothetical protein